MNWLTRSTQREYGMVQQTAALLLGQVLFLLFYPAFIFFGALLTDRWLGLPRFVHGLASPFAALALIMPGLILTEWTVGLQYCRGLGTPLPIVATRRLITSGPYGHCRNPMASGTTMVYLGIAVWLGSLSAVGLASLYPIVVTIYAKLVEEKELERRFGSEYVEYKRKTPFVLPRLSKKDCFGNRMPRGGA
jgi:protein-S-isoprenylcysteine O-methyltransferase Ste14